MKYALPIALLLLAALYGCQTTRPAPITSDVPEAPAVSTVVEFVPTTYIAPLALQEGPYPNLFAMDSYALWMGPEMAALKRAHAVECGEEIPPIVDAAVAHINSNFLVFECRLTSAFPDMSIGYDAVSFRGVSAYLLFPNGCTVEPVQVIQDSSMDESFVGAIRKFTRSNFVVFEKRDIVKGRQTIGPDLRAVRLVLEGHGNTFYFEWASATAPMTPWQPTAEEKAKSLKCGFINVYGRIVEFLSHFD